MRILITSLIVLCLLTSGCTARRKSFDIQYKQNDIILPESPELPVKMLTNESRYDTVMKAYVASVVLQKSYIEEVHRMVSYVSKK